MNYAKNYLLDLQMLDAHVTRQFQSGAAQPLLKAQEIAAANVI